jgi:hypothetical protein
VNANATQRQGSPCCRLAPHVLPAYAAGVATALRCLSPDPVSVPQHGLDKFRKGTLTTRLAGFVGSSKVVRPIAVGKVRVFGAKGIETKGWYFSFGRTDGGRLLTVVFTVRGQLLRVISARPMSRRERRGYVQATRP